MGRANKNASVLGWVAVILAVASVQASLGMSSGQYGNNNAASTNYLVLAKVKKTGQEQALCLARGHCFLKTLKCPVQCRQRKPPTKSKLKACFIDCSNKCETTCKRRVPNCKGFGSVCYDPRFVGGDGVMFYFHGAKGQTFALVTDNHLQINAYFIGNRPQGRPRDFTWVQSLAVLFHSHTLSVSARRVSVWDDNTDVLVLTWDDQEIVLPTDGEAEWRTTTTDVDGPQLVSVERTDELNSIRISVQGVVEIDVKAVPITEKDNRVHNYQIPAGDAFAHLEAQFKFSNLTAMVDGVLGRTYRPGYVSPVGRGGVPMPTMGGEDDYVVETLYSTHCRACSFRRPTTTKDDGNASVGALAQF